MKGKTKECKSSSPTKMGENDSRKLEKKNDLISMILLSMFPRWINASI